MNMMGNVGGFVSPIADATNGVVTYAVRVDFGKDVPDVKVGMTADVNIITARKQGVLLVPNTAIIPHGSGHAVRSGQKRDPPEPDGQLEFSRWERRQRDPLLDRID